jgi:hypothetical protein
MPVQSFLDIAIQLWGATMKNGMAADIPKSGQKIQFPFPDDHGSGDVYDALRTKRVYKDSFSHEECVSIIRAESGRHFDPMIVEAFLFREAEF